MHVDEGSAVLHPAGRPVIGGSVDAVNLAYGALW